MKNSSLSSVAAYAAYLLIFICAVVGITAAVFQVLDWGYGFTNDGPPASLSHLERSPAPVIHLSNVGGIWVTIPEIKSTPIPIAVESGHSYPPISASLQSVTMDHIQEVAFDFLTENGALTIAGHVYEGTEYPVGALYLPIQKQGTSLQKSVSGRLYILQAQTESPHWKDIHITVVQTNEESVMRVSFTEGEERKSVYLTLQTLKL